MSRLALHVFGQLAQVEGRVHGVRVDDVQFHEVGAWDSVADVVGACAGLVELGIRELVVTSLGLGSGSVGTAHGRLPVPVPAVLDLAAGWLVHGGGEGELATPTGVALVVALATGQGPMPAMRVTRHGVGAGTRDPADRPNVVRLVLGKRSHPTSSAAMAGAMEAASACVADLTEGSLLVGDMVLLEANVDDLDPRVWPTVLDALLEAGAADAWLVPIQMKKGRPAHTLSVLVPTGEADALRDAVFQLTTTLGVRAVPVRRWALARGWADVLVGGVPVPVKVAHRDGVIAQATPEFEGVAAAAARLGRPVRDILEVAVGAGVETGLVHGAPVPDNLRSTR